MYKTVAVFVENIPGVLTHISGLISRRGYNIESIAASSTEAPNVTRISLVFSVEDADQLEQIMNQLDKLIPVIRVVDISAVPHLSREMALVKIFATPDLRQEIINLVELFRGRIIDVCTEAMIIELTDESAKIDTFCQIMEQYGIIEIIRTGEVFLAKQAAASF